jgi:hypothetical protein
MLQAIIAKHNVNRMLIQQVCGGGNAVGIDNDWTSTVPRDKQRFIARLFNRRIGCYIERKAFGFAAVTATNNTGF